MTENGEARQPRTNFEVFKLLENSGRGVHAALGYQALALYANNTTLADTYFNHSMEALTSIERGAAEARSLPTQTDVYRQAMINLAPITRKLVVQKTLSPHQEVAEVQQDFIRDLGKQARAAKKSMHATPPANSPEDVHQSGLISGFNTFATLGLLMFAQTEMLKDDHRMALPAFIEPDWLSRDADGDIGIAIKWHINIFEGRNSTDFDKFYKLYVRNQRYSEHSDAIEPDVALVWVAEDLKLLGDDHYAVSQGIIADLDGKTKARHQRAEDRADKLLEVIDEREVSKLPGGIEAINKRNRALFPDRAFKR